VKSYNPILFNSIASLLLYANMKKKPEKRYSAVFHYNSKKESSTQDIKDTVDRMKEKTKELVDVKV